MIRKMCDDIEKHFCILNTSEHLHGIIMLNAIFTNGDNHSPASELKFVRSMLRFFEESPSLELPPHPRPMDRKYRRVHAKLDLSESYPRRVEDTPDSAVSFVANGISRRRTAGLWDRTSVGRLAIRPSLSTAPRSEPKDG